MARKIFNEAEDHSAPPVDAKPRNRCAANGCQMPGSIFAGGANEGLCAWHYGVNSSEWPRLTQILMDWECVTYEINDGRRSLTGVYARDPKYLGQHFTTAVARLRPLIAGSGYGTWFEAAQGEHYEDWVKRLEKFMGDQVHKQMSGQRQITEVRHVTVDN